MLRFLGQFLQRLTALPNIGDHMKELKTAADLEVCLAESEARPVLLLKHSTRCPISSGALGEVNAYLAQGGDDALPGYINLVVESRSVSNEIATVLGIQHASPQAFVIVNREARWNASHSAIQADAIRRAAVENA